MLHFFQLCSSWGKLEEAVKVLTLDTFITGCFPDHMAVSQVSLYPFPLCQSLRQQKTVMAFVLAAQVFSP